MFTLIPIIFCLASTSANFTSRVGFDGDGQPLVNRGNITLPSAVPWHVGIWEPVGPVYQQLCGGTLIAPNLIVTAAHCFWDYGTRKVIPNLETYRVALGKMYREWHLDDTNPHVQRMDIRRVVLDSRFDGYVRRNLENDIALVELTRNATLTDYVQVAAVDWISAVPPNGSVGVVAGWGYTENREYSHELRSIELPYIDHDTCYQSLGEDRFKKLLTSDKFCAGFINKGKSVCQGDSGGGFITIDKETNAATVRGIVSIDFRPREFPKSQCYPLHYTAFTNIGEPRYRAWIRDHQSVDPALSCPALTRRTHVQHVTCWKEMVNVECAGSMAADTLAITQCADGYFAGNLTSFRSMCSRDGTWTNRDVECEEGCGRQNIISTRIDREEVQDGEQPWNVAVYWWIASFWGHRCAGTLISPTHVITSAYCVDNWQLMSTTFKFKLSARKHFLGYSDLERNSQTADVKSHFVHEAFDKESGRSAIAILVADRGFQLSSAVAVACIDWDGKQKSKASDSYIATSKQQSTIKRDRKLASIQRYTLSPGSNCDVSKQRRSGISSRIHQSSSDKFCAQPDGAEACVNYIAGGGLMRQSGGKFFLWGVNGVPLDYFLSGACASNQRHLAFIKVDQYLPWIRQKLGQV